MSFTLYGGPRGCIFFILIDYEIIFVYIWFFETYLGGGLVTKSMKESRFIALSEGVFFVFIFFVF